MKELIGKQVTDIKISIHRDSLYVQTDYGSDAKTYIYSASGDCCSQCYIESVEPFYGEVLSVEDIPLVGVSEEVCPIHNDHDKYCNVLACGKDCDCSADKWGYKIKTDLTHGSVHMRLEHNGYYSGDLDLYKIFEGSIQDYIAYLKKNSPDDLLIEAFFITIPNE